MSQDFIPQAFGWENRPHEVAKFLQEIEDQGNPAFFCDAAPALMVADDNAPVFFWEIEEKVLGKRFPAWSQGRVGSCVSFGYSRGINDLMLWQVANGNSEQYAGEPCEIAIYAGSRVNIAHGQFSGHDGSCGAFAAKWVTQFGVLLRQVYKVGNNTYDLTQYSEDLARKYGEEGCPVELESIAKQHPVKSVALVQNGDEAWAALGNCHPIPVCSSRGFTTNLVDGFCHPDGIWGHCMVIRGRFISPKYGKSFVIQNSWGDYLAGRGDNHIEVEGRGMIQLSQGCFATTIDVIDSMMKQNDSFALAGITGWTRERLDYTPMR